MPNNRFKIVFKKLAEAEAQERGAKKLVREVAELAAEAEEIDELRRLVAETNAPPPKSYTIT